MNETLKSMKSDLAFMKAVAEDRGPIPALLGWHLIGIGGVFGFALLHVWSVYAGLTPWPEEAKPLLWLPGVLVYAPINAFIGIRGRHKALGPTARVFGAAWAAMGMMSIPAVLVLVLGEAQTGEPFHGIWPALALVLYGGAWVTIAMICRKLWNVLIAAGCFAAGLLCALLIRDPAQWLVMAGGFSFLVGAPGVGIVLAARRASET